MTEKTAEQLGAEQRLNHIVDQKKAENNVAPNEPITTVEGKVVEPKKDGK